MALGANYCRIPTQIAELSIRAKMSIAGNDFKEAERLIEKIKTLPVSDATKKKYLKSIENYKISKISK